MRRSRGPSSALSGSNRTLHHNPGGARPSVPDRSPSYLWGDSPPPVTPHPDKASASYSGAFALQFSSSLQLGHSKSSIGLEVGQGSAGWLSCIEYPSQLRFNAAATYEWI